MRNQEAPYSGIAGLMAAQGRYGDTELLHVRPDELAGLASIGQLTVNPDTGLPEAFSFRSLLPAVGAIAGSILLPGAGTALGSGLMAGAIGSGVGSFVGGLAAGQSPTQALIGGLMSGATSGIMGGLTGGADSILSTIPEAGASSMTPIASAASDAAAAQIGQAGAPIAFGQDAAGLASFGYSPADIAQFSVASQGVPGQITPEVLNAARSVTPSTTANLQSSLPKGANPALNRFGGVDMIPSQVAGRAVPPPQSGVVQDGFGASLPSQEAIAKMAAQTGGIPESVLANPIPVPTGTETMVPISEDVAKNLSKGFLSPDIKPGFQPVPDVIQSGGLEVAGVLADKGYNVGMGDIAAGKLGRIGTYFGLGKAALGEMMNPTPDEEEREDDDALSSLLASSYTPRNLRLTGGQFTGSGDTQEDITRVALEGGRRPPLTPFTYEEDTVTLAEGGEVAVEETDTVVEEETVDSENKRKEEEILQKKKAASEVDKFISESVGGAALNAMVGQVVNQDPGAIATPYGQGGDGFNVGGDFGFYQGGLVGLATGGTPRNGSKKNSFTPKQELVYSFFKEKGYPSESIAAIMGNIAVEAPTFDFTQRESGKKKGTNQGMGLFQYTGGRQKDYTRYLKENNLKDSAPNQMEYFHEQISSTVPDGELPYDAGGLNRKRLQKILLGEGMGAVEERADVIREIFLRPKKGKEHIERRMNESLNMFELIPDEDITLEYNKGGGIGQYFEGKVTGPGDGQSDQVLFEVEGKNPDMALLSPDEYVIPADTVAMIGSGSSSAGAKKLDGFVKNIRQEAIGSKKQQKPIKQGLESFLA